MHTRGHLHLCCAGTQLKLDGGQQTFGGLTHEPDSSHHSAHRGRPWWERRWSGFERLEPRPVGNSIAGALGGGVGGQILNAILGIGGTAVASGLDIGSVVSAFVTGGVSGGVTALIVGFLKSRMAS
jgi:hypothetical protein